MLTILSIAAAMWSMLAFAAMARGVVDQIMEDAIANLTGHIQVHAKNYVDDPNIDNSMPPTESSLLNVLNDSRVKSWAPRIRVPAVVMSERESSGVMLVGIEPNREKDLSFIGKAVAKGHYFSTDAEEGVILGAKLAQRLKTELGKRVVIISQNERNELVDRGFKVVGLFEAALESTELGYAFLTIGAARKFLGLEAAISEISLLLRSEVNMGEILKELKTAAPRLDIKPWTVLQPLIQATVRIQNGFLLLWFSIVIVTVSFGLINTLFMAIYERVREFGLLLAIGMDRKTICMQILGESFFLLLAGAISGNLLGWLNIYWLRDGIDLSRFAEGTQLAGLRSVLYPTLRVSDCFAINLMVFLLGMISSVYPAWRASRFTPVEAMRKQ